MKKTKLYKVTGTALVLVLAAGLLYFAQPWKAKCDFPGWIKIDGTEHTYCKDGVYFPLIRLDITAPIDQRFHVYVNNEKVFESKPPTNIRYTTTLNQYVHPNARNHIRVEFEKIFTLHRFSGGPSQIEVSVGRQPIWSEPENIEPIDAAHGPTKAQGIEYNHGAIELVFDL